MDRSYTKTATIANGASLSDAIELDFGEHAALEMPAAWTAADITFLAASTREGTYKPVVDIDGNELKATGPAAGEVVLLGTVLAPLRFLKLRSGTAALAVNQAAERKLNLILKG